MIQNVHSLQAWRDFLQILVNAGLIPAEASFLKWPLIWVETRENWYSWVLILQGLILLNCNYKSVVSFCPLCSVPGVCVLFLIVYVYEDSPRKKIQSGCCFPKTQTEPNCFILTRFMTSIAKQLRSVIHQSEWLSLDRLCHFPSETTHEKVLELALVCLVEKEWRHNSVFWSPSQRLWGSWCQCSDREADPSGSSDTCQALNDSSPGSAGLLVPRCYPSFPWAFWLTSLSTLEHLPTQPLLPPAILSMSYRLCFLLE